MKIRADEHVAPKIVGAVRDIALRSGWELSSIHDVDQAGSSDVHWITAFASDGGDAILTADKDFFTLEPQINAVFDTGVRVLHLPKRWSQARRDLQAAHILQWWRRLEDKLQEMCPRECYRPDWNIVESGTLKRVKIDFAGAHRKRRKKKK